MNPRHLNALDERLTSGACAHCGAPATTVDHVPSRVLLDEPFPDNLSVVSACRLCNVGFSLDEQYLACLIECVVSGTTTPSALGREKIRKILSRDTSLRMRIANSCNRTSGDSIWQPEEDRVRAVLTKLGRGHAAHEFGSAPADEPSAVRFMPFLLMSEDERRRFETAPPAVGWPEIGSRAFMFLIEGKPDSAAGAWRVIQPNRYRYMAADEYCIRIVLSEYLACEVSWDE